MQKEEGKEIIGINNNRKESSSSKFNSKPFSKTKYSGETHKVDLISLILVLLTILIFLLEGTSGTFYVVAALTFLVFFPNRFWLKQSYAQPFILPYVLTMVKTKKFINYIHAAVSHAWVLEKMSFVGLFLGFGLTYIDYWKARKLGGLRRILLLLLGAIIFSVFYWGFFTLIPVFSTPALAPLYFFGLVSFVILGFGGFSLALLIGYGIISVQSFFISKQICPSVAPVIPGVPIPGFGVVIPLIAWISLGMILIIHEASHGVLLSYYKNKIHSVGLLLAGIFPAGAFVEQDDKEFNKAKDEHVLMVLSAGPSSNLATMVLAVLFMMVFSFALTPFSAELDDEYKKIYAGVVVKNVQDKVSYCGIDYNSPAKGVLLKGDKIISANGVDVNSTTVIKKAISESGANKTDVNFVVRRNDSNIFVKMNPVRYEDLNLSLIGVEFEVLKTDYQLPLLTFLFVQIISAIDSISVFFILLSFAVGTFNFLPSDPLDGGKIAKIVLEPYAGFMKLKSSEDTRKFIGRLFAWLFLISILLNLIPYLTM